MNYKSQRETPSAAVSSESSADSASALARATALTSSAAPEGVFSDVVSRLQRYQSMSHAEYAAEVETLTALKNTDRYMATFLLYTAWGERDPHGALEFLNSSSLTDGQQDYARRIVYKAWTAQDPQAAITRLTQSPEFSGDDRSTRYDIATITNEWLKRDREAAFTWLQGLDSKHKGRALSEFFSSMSQQDMDYALQKVSALAPEDQSDAASEIAEQWGRNLDWNVIQSNITQLPADTQQEALKAALYRFASQQPYEATAIISEIDADDEEKFRYVREVADAVGEENPAGILEWGLSNLQGRYQNRVTHEVFTPWVKRAPAEAATWLMTQPNDMATQRMYKGMLSNKTLSTEIKDSLKAHFQGRAE